MIRSTISQLAKRPVVPQSLANAIAQQPGVLSAAIQRIPFSTKVKAATPKEKTHTVPVEESKEERTPATQHPLEPLPPFRHPFWSNSLWDDNDFFFHPRDPFAPFFGRDLFAGLRTPTIGSLLRNPPDTGLARLPSSPGYDWQEYDDHIELNIQVPEGVDAKVDVDDENRTLHIHGKRSDESPTYVSKLRFDQRFVLPQNADIEAIKARVDGTLKVTVPTTSKPRRSIPVEKEIPTEEEVVQKSYSDAFDESDWAETGKKAA